ncbi:MAG: endonuclease domain-containing protein [bacterium]|nr:endonuclease domain-containing protein [bacterium]
MNRLNNLPPLKERRVELRKNQTPEEALLWQKLRQRKLGPKFKRQHSVGPYILDFYCPERRLAIELDGFQHVENKGYDKERSNYLSDLGIKVVRFWNSEVSDNIDFVLSKISLELSLRPAKGEVLAERRG